MSLFTEPRKLKNHEKIILDLCGGCGAWSFFYKKAGYDVRNITLPEYNVLAYNPPERVYGVLAAPPCESFSYAPRKNGRHNGCKKMSQAQGLEIVEACLWIIRKTTPHFYAIENPNAELRHFLGKPSLVFQPYEYGDQWTKQTAVWGNFNIPPSISSSFKNNKQDLYVRPKRELPSLAMLHHSDKYKIASFAPFWNAIKTDYDLRSITPQGFAKAFFTANQ